MIYTALILFVLYFEYGIYVAMAEPLHDVFGNVIDLDNDPEQYRFVVLTIILIAGAGVLLLTLHEFLQKIRMI
ncbi:hypothetical protein LCGC14_1133270, partial [marine sediment metagenome]